jgi:hypothetical protein
MKKEARERGVSVQSMRTRFFHKKCDGRLAAIAWRIFFVLSGY